MLNYQIKIGLMPMRRNVAQRPGIFNWEKAEVRGREAVEYIKSNFTSENVSFIDLKGINEVEVLFNDQDAQKVIERFRAEAVDAIILINGNFGEEEVAGHVARAINKPILLWAPLDDEIRADGMRFTDSQCGIFGISRQMQRLNIPFSYIENCRITESIFSEGLHQFFSVVCMVKNFRNLRVGQVGMRPKPFYSVIFNEGELLQRFGIEVVPVNLAVVIDKFNRILTERDAELSRGAEFLQKRYEIDELSQPVLKKVYAFVLLYEDIFREFNVQIISSECWTAMQLGVGAMPCTAFAILADMGYIVGCESDVHGTLTMALLSCASLGKKIPFFGEFTVRHPEDKNVELLWHCGPFAYSLKKATSPAKMVNMREWFEVKAGKYTVARFEQDDGRYLLLNGTCQSAEGPYTFGTYLWARFDNLSKWERKLVEGPYIHHMAEIEGDYTGALREFCKFIPHLNPDSVE